MDYQQILFEPSDELVRITLNRSDKRNALSFELMTELLDAFRAAGATKSLGVLLAANGPVFSAGHDFADMAGRDLAGMRALLARCNELMREVQNIPQPVLAKVQGTATAAGCQLVATCDLAVAAEDAKFATPGGKGGWFCTTPMVAVSRSVGRKRALELLMTGDSIDAREALDWGLLNRVVPEAELESASLELLSRATRGSPLAKGIGKQAFYAQIDMDQPKAYAYALEVMAASALTDDGQEQMSAFLEKRRPVFKGS
jgi:enoyl-CoA hydratase/carnithine racemase